MVALAVGTFSLAYPVFSGGFLVSPHSDQYIAGYAFREFAAQSLRQGHGFPQWSADMFGGLPYVAAMHGDIFYPTFLLRMIMRTDLAMTWGFIIHLFLAGAFTLGFLRAWGLKVWPAAFGALAYMMSGTIASYASPGHDGKIIRQFTAAAGVVDVGARNSRWAHVGLGNFCIRHRARRAVPAPATAAILSAHGRFVHTVSSCCRTVGTARLHPTAKLILPRPSLRATRVSLSVNWRSRWVQLSSGC